MARSYDQKIDHPGQSYFYNDIDPAKDTAIFSLKTLIRNSPIPVKIIEKIVGFDFYGTEYRHPESLNITFFSIADNTLCIIDATIPSSSNIFPDNGIICRSPYLM